MTERKIVTVVQPHIEGDLIVNVGATGDVPAAVEATLRNLPERQPGFAGRESELTELHERLSTHVEVGITQQAAVHAHGGVGKTALAVEYAWRHLEDFPGGQYFLSCDNESGPLALHELALCIGVPEGETSDETAGRVRERLEGGDRSLLILDNVRDGAQWTDERWSKYLPGGNCCRLITTRTELLPGVEMYPLLRLTPEDGRALLEQYRPDVSENEEVVARVVEWFDGLAVGLTVVGAYMAVRDGLTWEQYAASLEAKGLGTVRATEDEVGPLTDYDARVDSVFDDLLDELGEGERRALEYCALLPADQVHRVWLTELLEGDEDIELTEPPGYSGNPSGAVLGALMRQRILVSRAEGEDVLSVHRVLLQRLNERLDEYAETRDGLLDQVVALADRRGNASRDALTDLALRPELGSLLALSDELMRRDRVEAAASLANWVHTPLHGLGRYEEDRASLERFAGEEVLARLSRARAASILGNLALILQDLGELPEARRLMERAIEIQELHLDADHPKFAISYTNLAMILQDLGELPEARRLIERAIEIDEMHFEPDHPTLAISYSNLAMILQDLGELPEARRLMERAIEINELHFDADHPTLAGSYSNLALILKALGELPEARRLTERAIAINELHLDANHPTLATTYSNLAMILQGLGELPEARRLMERAIEIEEHNFEPDHPTLAMGYSNLASILHDLGELPEARRLMERAIEIEEHNFEPDHPTLAMGYSNLAVILKDLGELPEARRLMERAIEIHELNFGTDHPTLASRYSNLAMILQDLGELPEARRLMEHTIEVQELHFDADHPTLATSYNNLGHIELASGTRVRACELFNKALNILAQHFGPDHPHVLTVKKTIDRHCSSGSRSG